MWQTAVQISTPIALVAFCIAAVTTAYRLRLKRDENIISAASSEESQKLTLAILDRVPVDVDDLTKQQKYDLALKTLQIRMRKMLYVTITTVIVAILAAVILIVAVIRGGSKVADNQEYEFVLAQKSITLDWIKEHGNLSAKKTQDFEVLHDKYLEAIKSNNIALQLDLRGQIYQIWGGQYAMLCDAEVGVYKNNPEKILEICSPAFDHIVVFAPNVLESHCIGRVGMTPECPNGTTG